MGDQAKITERPVPEMDPEAVWEKLGISAEKDVDFSRPETPEEFRKMSIRVAGFGGQGIMVTGQALASVAWSTATTYHGFPVTDQRCAEELRTVR